MDLSRSWGNPLRKGKENMGTSRLTGRFSLLLLAFAVMVSIAAVAMGWSVKANAQTPAPTIQSDLSDYGPGDTVTLTGSNWQPGELVNIYVNDDLGKTWERNVDVTADANGAIRDQFQLPSWFVATYKVTATGAQSGVADRKRTRLNSSHANISYAVFCLKKKPA